MTRRKKGGALNLYLTVAVAVIAALGSLLSVNVFFNIEESKIEVNGTSLYTAEQVRYVGGITGGQNLVRLNTDFIANRLKKNLVYVEDVTVEKKYPDGLTVSITEATEAAELKTDDGYCLISEAGRVLEHSDERIAEDLPLVVGYEPESAVPGSDARSKDDQKTSILVSLFEQMKAVGMDKIGQIDLTERTDIKLMYDGRIEICLGSSVDLDIKLSWIKKVLDSQLPDSYEGTLRYNGIDSGISAIPKEADVPTKPAASSSSADGSSLSSAQDVYGENTLTDSFADDTSDGGYDDRTGYSDGTGYNDGTGYGDGGYGYDTGYDYNAGYDYNTDYGYDYGYDDGGGYQAW